MTRPHSLEESLPREIADFRDALSEADRVVFLADPVAFLRAWIKQGAPALREALLLIKKRSPVHGEELLRLVDVLAAATAAHTRSPIFH